MSWWDGGWGEREEGVGEGSADVGVNGQAGGTTGKVPSQPIAMLSQLPHPKHRKDDLFWGQDDIYVPRSCWGAKIPSSLIHKGLPCPLLAWASACWRHTTLYSLLVLVPAILNLQLPLGPSQPSQQTDQNSGAILDTPALSCPSSLSTDPVRLSSTAFSSGWFCTCPSPSPF